MEMPSLNYPAWMFWFSVAQIVFTGLVALYARKLAKDKAVETRLKSLEEGLAGCVSKEKCAEHERRTTEIAIELEHLPNQKQFDKLNVSINNLNSQLGITSGRLEGINRAVDLINEFLINQGGSKK